MRSKIRTIINKIEHYWIAKRYRYLDNFIFIHINKNAGSSIEKALNIPFEHKTALEKIEEVGYMEFSKKFTFAVVRNPFDKVVSQYCYRLQKNQKLSHKKQKPLGLKPIDFKEWVKLTYREKDSFYFHNPSMFRPQYQWITDSNGQIIIDFICRFENLSSDLEVVQNKINKEIKLPHSKKTKRSNYREYYDNETKEIITNYFLKDIDLFEYEF